jgi:hypothetical protein
VTWSFYGGRLRLEGISEGDARLRVALDGGLPQVFPLPAGSWAVELPGGVGLHSAQVTVETGAVVLARIRVGRGGEAISPALSLGWLALLMGGIVGWSARSRLQARR